MGDGHGVSSHRDKPSRDRSPADDRTGGLCRRFVVSVPGRRCAGPRPESLGCPQRAAAIRSGDRESRSGRTSRSARHRTWCDADLERSRFFPVPRSRVRTPGVEHKLWLVDLNICTARYDDGMEPISMSDARRRFYRVIARVEEGATFLLTRRGAAVATIRPIATSPVVTPEVTSAKPRP